MKLAQCCVWFHCDNSFVVYFAFTLYINFFALFIYFVFDREKVELGVLANAIDKPLFSLFNSRSLRGLAELPDSVIKG